MEETQPRRTVAMSTTVAGAACWAPGMKSAGPRSTEGRPVNHADAQPRHTTAARSTGGSPHRRAAAEPLPGGMVGGTFTPRPVFPWAEQALQTNFGVFLNHEQHAVLVDSMHHDADIGSENQFIAHLEFQCPHD